MSKDLIEAITVIDDQQIRGFFEEYRWLSNFHEAPVEFEGVTYKSSEGAYQAAKTLDKAKRLEFVDASPANTKKLGRSLSLREDWEEVKDDVMYQILKSKFSLNNDLRIKLLATGDRYLEETNYWNDTYWGVCNSLGKNKLGKLLMKLRDEIR